MYAKKSCLVRTKKKCFNENGILSLDFEIQVNGKMCESNQYLQCFGASNPSKNDNYRIVWNAKTFQVRIRSTKITSPKIKISFFSKI